MRVLFIFYYFMGFLFFTQTYAQVADRDQFVEKIEIRNGKKVKVLYPKKSSVDFEGVLIEGEIKNPGEFYFQRRPQEKFDSLLKRRENFHPEMLRDGVLSR